MGYWAAAGLTTLGAGGGLLVRELGGVGVRQGYAPEQPIAFSHAVHATAGAPCLYCHFAARTSRHAGIPPASVCLGCHRLMDAPSAEVQKLKEALAQGRPVAWARVHDLPDFVRFDHSRHLAAGVDCAECHGAVASMDRARQDAPLTMGWCVECHRGSAAGPSAGPTALDCGRCHH